MKLYSSVGPNPGVVALFVAEKKLQVETVTLDIMRGENREPAYLAINPLGGTPALELDTGQVMTESIAICEYLEELHPHPPLIGSTPEERAETRMWVRRVDLQFAQPAVLGFRGAEGLALFKDRMRCVPEGAAGLKAVAADGLAFIDAELAKAGPYLCGERFTLVDLLLLAFVDFGKTIGQPADFALAHLAGWHSRVTERTAAP